MDEKLNEVESRKFVGPQIVDSNLNLFTSDLTERIRRKNRGFAKGARLFRVAFFLNLQLGGQIKRAIKRMTFPTCVRGFRAYGLQTVAHYFPIGKKKFSIPRIRGNEMCLVRHIL